MKRQNVKEYSYSFTKYYPPGTICKVRDLNAGGEGGVFL